MNPNFPPVRVVAALFLAISDTGAGLLAEPSRHGFSEERLERIDVWLQGMVDRRDAAGFVTYISRKGQVAHHKAFGNRGMDTDDPMPQDGIFDVASMTKPVVAVAALMLIEEGELLIDDPISKRLPEYANPKVKLADGALVEANREITVRDLLTHTSGISDGLGRKDTYEFETIAEYGKAVAKMPLQNHPGERYLYGDSFHVLGYLVQEVSGQRLDQFIAERITRPLGMKDTHYWPPDAKDHQRAILVVDGEDDLDSSSRLPAGAAERATFFGGGSGLYSTARDYGVFCQMLLNRGELGGHRYLGPQTIDWMASDHIGDTPGRRNSENTGFGLSVAVVDNKSKRPLIVSRGTYYWGGSQGTIFWIDPEEEIVAVLMVQINPNRLQLRERLYSYVYSALVD